MLRKALPVRRFLSDRSRSCAGSLFGHVARLPEDTPAHQALRFHIDLSLGLLANRSWRRYPGRPRTSWLDQLRRDNSTLPADLWRRAVTRGHSGVTLRSSTTASALTTTTTTLVHTIDCRVIRNRRERVHENLHFKRHHELKFLDHHHHHHHHLFPQIISSARSVLTQYAAFIALCVNLRSATVCHSPLQLYLNSQRI